MTRTVVCGSSRLADAVAAVAASLPGDVLAPEFNGDQPDERAVATWLRAIAEADEVVAVVGDDLRIGEHVAAELRHARDCGVPIRLVIAPGAPVSDAPGPTLTS